MLKNLLLFLTILTCTSLNAQTWDGGGDGTSWDDAENWSNDTIPLENANVIFDIGTTATITGAAPNSIGRIFFDTLTNVTLDLDLNIGVDTTTVHNIAIKKGGNITFGGTSEMRTFNFLTASNRNTFLLNSEEISVTISEQATVNINTCKNAIRINKAQASFVNNGTLNSVNYIEHGIYLIKGTITNNGTMNIGTGTEDEEPTSDGINIAEEGLFNNNTHGTINITQPLDDGLEIFGIFNNAGTISTISSDTALANNSGIAVGSMNSTGTLNNLAGGIINTDGGTGELNRAFAIQASGSFTNAGYVSVSGGNLGQSFYNVGTLTNETCAQIDLIATRILNNNAGVLTNNGLITSSYTAAGINHGAADGSAVNNTFYGYTNVNAAFSGGNAESIDNGVKTGEGIIVDAENSCMVADIGIDIPYTWYTDAAGTIEAGTNDANGMLTLNDGIFDQPGTQVLYTCFGEAVQLNIENISGGCLLVSVRDLVQLKDVFTLTPNPAQTYAQISFGHEYISSKKTLTVYNSVGQLILTVNSNGADNYLLDTNNFAAGFYTVNLQTEKGIQIERLVIQK